MTRRRSKSDFAGLFRFLGSFVGLLLLVFRLGFIAVVIVGFRVIIVMLAFGVVAMMIVAVAVTVSMIAVTSVEFFGFLKGMRFASDRHQSDNSYPKQSVAEQFHGVSFSPTDTFCNFHLSR